MIAEIRIYRTLLLKRRTGAEAFTSYQLNLHRLTQRRRGTGKRRQGQTRMRIIQQAIERRSAGVHKLCHGSFGELLCFHTFFNLQGEYLFQCGGCGLLVQAFLVQKIIKVAANGHGGSFVKNQFGFGPMPYLEVT